MKKESKVSVIILNWNGLSDTLECLESIKRLNTEGFHLNVIVVDNGSTDDSVKRIKEIKNIETVFNDRNLGFAEGNNIGINYALKNGSDYIIILNNDVIVHGNAVKELVKMAQADSKIGVISPKIYFAKGFEFHKGKYKENDLGKVIWYAGGRLDWNNVYGSTYGVDEVDSGQFDKAGETDFATGTCMLLSRKALEDFGAFDEKYFMYYEDTDLSVRAKKFGYKVMYNPNSIIWHKVAQGSGIGSSLNDYYTTRNRMLFGMGYSKMRTKFALIRESIKLLLSGRTWQRIGIRDYYLGRFGKGSWK